MKKIIIIILISILAVATVVGVFALLNNNSSVVSEAIPTPSIIETTPIPTAPAPVVKPSPTPTATIAATTTPSPIPSATPEPEPTPEPEDYVFESDWLNRTDEEVRSDYSDIGIKIDNSIIDTYLSAYSGADSKIPITYSPLSSSEFNQDYAEDVTYDFLGMFPVSFIETINLRDIIFVDELSRRLNTNENGTYISQRGHSYRDGNLIDSDIIVKYSEDKQELFKNLCVSLSTLMRNRVDFSGTNLSYEDYYKSYYQINSSIRKEYYSGVSKISYNEFVEHYSMLELDEALKKGLFSDLGLYAYGRGYIPRDIINLLGLGDDLKEKSKEITFDPVLSGFDNPNPLEMKIDEGQRAFYVTDPSITPIFFEEEIEKYLAINDYFYSMETTLDSFMSYNINPD